MFQKESYIHIYDPPFHIQKIYKYQKAVYERKGHWTQKEKIKYGVFLEVFRDRFQDRENPILNKMFRVMSQFIKTRNHNQCRSHHQKMEKQRFEIDSILESIKSKYPPREYQLSYQKYTKHIKALNVNMILMEKGFTPHKNIENRRRKPNDYGIGKTTRATCRDSEKIFEIQIEKNNNIKVAFESIKDHEFELIQSDRKLKVKEIQNSLQLPKITFEKKLVKSPLNQNNNEKNNQQIILKKQITQLEDFKNQNQKTGLEYEQQEENSSDNIVHVQIPQEIEFKPADSKISFDMSLSSLGYPLRLPSESQHLLGYSLPSDVYPFRDPYEQSLCMQIKNANEQRQWHLNQASKLYNQMNEQIYKANTCEQTKDMLTKQLMEMRTRGFAGFRSQF